MGCDRGVTTVPRHGPLLPRQPSSSRQSPIGTDPQREGLPGRGGVTLVAVGGDCVAHPHRENQPGRGGRHPGQSVLVVGAVTGVASVSRGW